MMRFSANDHDRSARPAIAFSMMVALLLTVTSIVSVVEAGPEASDALVYSLVSVPDASAHLERLASLGIAIDDGFRRGDALEVVVNGRERSALAAAGLPFTVIVSDLTAFYAERAARESHLWKDLDRDDGFGLGSMGGFYTNGEVVAKLDEMRADYPHLISQRQILSVTLEGRPIWLTRISDNPDIEEGEPSILYTSATHAREPMGMAAVVYYMFYLLENYGTDPEVTYLIDNRELYFVPVLNPDGYVFNEMQAPGGGGMWRKNRRDNGNGTFGVDPSRNYGYLWGYDNIGSSPNPGAQTYRGPAPFSEMETTGVRLFHEPRTITAAMHYHAFGEFEIHPFGYEPDAFPPAPDLAWYQLYGQDLMAMNGYLYGTPWQTLQYLTNGDALDWSYGEQEDKNKVFAFAPEVGTDDDGFWPAPSRILPIAEQNRGPNLYMAWIAGPRVTSAQIAAGPEVPRGEYSDVVVTLTNIGLTDADDVAVEVSSSDPYVEDVINPSSFPAIPPQSDGDNQADPASFLVAATAPVGHVIELEVIARQGEVVMSQSTVQVTVVEGTTGLAGGGPALATRPRITARPNPFNPRTELSVSIDAAGPIRLAIYDTEGRLVRILHQAVREAGDFRVIFDGRDHAGRELPSGVYVARLETARNSTNTRLVLLR
jgi:hypothetical protein